MTLLELDQIKPANAELFLGTSFKRVKALEPLSLTFKISEKVTILSVKELSKFFDFYKAYREPENLPLDETELSEQVKSGEAYIYVVRNIAGTIQGGIVVKFLRLPGKLNQHYFGANFERFAYMHSFVCKESGTSLIYDLFGHLFLSFEALGLKMVCAHVLPEHQRFCDLILPKNKFKRLFGENFGVDDTLLCLDLC